MLDTGLGGRWYDNNNPRGVLVLGEFKSNEDKRPLNNQCQQK